MTTLIEQIRCVPKSPIIISLVLTFGISSLNADSFVTVFGYPLGGKMSPPKRECTTDEITSAARSICWLGETFVHDNGAKSGTVLLPNEDSLPAWAAYGSMSMRFSKEGMLDEITVTSRKSKSELQSIAIEIAQSITARFGSPSRANLLKGSSQYTAEWPRSDLHIGLSCLVSRCTATFTSPKAQADFERWVDERKKAEKARPVSP